MGSPALRDTTIDTCRGVGIVLVVYAHALEITFPTGAALPNPAFWLWQMIYAFHMPLFFFISGTLHSKKDWGKTITLVIFLVFLAESTHLIGAAFGLLFDATELNRTIKSLLILSHFSIITTWYLIAHAWVASIAQAMHYSKTRGRIFLVSLMLIALLATQKLNLTALQIQAVPVGALFYWFGWRFQRNLLGLLTSAKPTALFAIAATTIMATHYLAPLNNGCSLSQTQKCPDFHGAFGVSFQLGCFGFWPLFIPSAIAGIIAIVTSSILMNRLNYYPLSRVISKLGSNTVEILIVNGFFLAFIQPAIANRFNTAEGGVAFTP